MGKYYIEQSVNGTSLFYEPYYGERLLKQYIEQLKHYKIEGLASMEITLRQGREVVRYLINDKQSLGSYLKNGISEEELLELLERILEVARAVQEARVAPAFLLFDLSCIFVGKTQKNVEFVLHVSDFGQQKNNEFGLIKEVLAVAQVNSNQYNVKEYLEQYIGSRQQVSIDDFREYISNIKKQLFDQRQYSGKQTLSCRLGDQSIQIEELLEIASPKFVTTRMMEEEALEQKAYLVRCSTKEQIPITKAMFTLGTDQNQVDYAIAGNRAISRVHAMILYRNGSYFIKDMDSTNHTFVNRFLVRGGSEMDLAPGSSVILANEAFVFEMDQTCVNDNLLF